MGGNCRNRVREFVFRDVTRHVLHYRATFAVLGCSDMLVCPRSAVIIDPRSQLSDQSRHNYDSAWREACKFLRYATKQQSPQLAAATLSHHDGVHTP